MDLPYDLQTDLITVSDAATLAGVSESAIRKWKQRGHLDAAGEDDFGRPLFLGIAVLRAEARTRRRARRELSPAASRDAS